MEERDVQTASEPRPPTSPAPVQDGRSKESGWFVALKPLFWFILLPAVMLLLVKWVLQL